MHLKGHSSRRTPGKKRRELTKWRSIVRHIDCVPHLFSANRISVRSGSETWLMRNDPVLSTMEQPKCTPPCLMSCEQHSGPQGSYPSVTSVISEKEADLHYRWR
jgi:hypothetical protein